MFNFYSILTNFCSIFCSILTNFWDNFSQFVFNFLLNFDKSLEEFDPFCCCCCCGGCWGVKGQSADLRQLSVHALLPETDHYMTYEGSTTHPGCWETTSWIVFNKPIYISRQEVAIFTQIHPNSPKYEYCKYAALIENMKFVQFLFNFYC